MAVLFVSAGRHPDDYSENFSGLDMIER